MAQQDRAGSRSSSSRKAAQAGQASNLYSRGGDESRSVTSEIEHPAQSPYFHAQHSARYERQGLIATYEATFGCRLVAIVGPIFPPSITLFEELIFDATSNEDLHILLASPGGDGETAVRLVRSAQARCQELTVIVPDQAKSAATILAMGAHHILMGPTSDLGPVDPQFQVGDRSLVAAKDIIAAVEQAEKAIAKNENVFPLHAALLEDVNALMVQQARSAISRTDELVEEALKSNPDRSGSEVKRLKKSLKTPLIDAPKNHGAIFSGEDARNAGLPVILADPAGDQWKVVWQLWARYFLLDSLYIYEGRRSSQELPRR